ncbi:MAG: macrocin O-methyltransferase [Verrucomicrobia bacterium]|nr:macrocin O-methyltransferase [Verrucomicrobiota bacterium]
MSEKDVSAELYLDLLKKCLSFTLWDARDGSQEITAAGPVKRALKRLIKGQRRTGSGAAEEQTARREGRDWPRLAHTMIGALRLENLQFCIQEVLRHGVAGDLIETGAWRGGATIFMRAMLKVHGVTDRCVWVADSFEGLPKPDTEKYPADAGDVHHRFKPLAVSLEEVQENFRKYGLLDDQVRFLKGWFKDTLPTAPIERLAVLRLDGDMYESTMDALVHLYPKLAVGGYLIVDDYGAVPGCARAVEDYRRSHGISEPVQTIDWSGVHWRRTQ